MRFSCDAACEGDSRVTLRGSYGLFIGGSFTGGSSVFKTISPATEEVLAEVTHGTTEDVDRAVAAARQADPADPERGPAAGDRALLLPRGLGRQARLRRVRVGGGRPAPAARRRRA